MKKIKKNDSKTAQSIKTFMSLCGCRTCQDCTSSSSGLTLANTAASNHVQGELYLLG